MIFASLFDDRNVTRRATLAGLLASAAGVALLAVPGLIAAALGVEAVALAFWLWARTAPDRHEQLARWAWLRRPAMALWLAAALALALPASPPPARVPAGESGVPRLVRAIAPDERDPLRTLRALQALAVLWAGLELLAASPASRAYPDLTGPLPAVGSWLPAMLPAAGFLVLWRQDAAWSHAPLMREVAGIALVLAAGLAVLRAYARRTWTASLRWLAVFDSALAGLLVAFDVVPGEVAFLLWFAAAGGRLMALAAELRGSAARRGQALARLWRLAGWTAGAALAWPLLVGVGFAGRTFRPVEFVVLAAPVFLASALSLRRVVEVPERRTVPRLDAGRLLGLLGALATLALGPLALLLAWWAGFEASFPGALIALLPPVLAAWPRARAAAPPPPGAAAPVTAGAGARDFALSVFRSVTWLEGRLAAALGVLLRAVSAPARGLHTGDAQEYLLFLAGVSVLALLLPLLR
ncbi:MAG: hypothetical protein IT347_06620 [Candidatus Eisenbacteria bacterium]|nr:hypothetical protein [Candidatus Eisenbacteria bacterium]